MSDPRLTQATRLDAVVATIDAVNGLENLDDHPVASRQCAVADRRVITKADLGEAGDVAALAARLRALNPAPIFAKWRMGASMRASFSAPRSPIRRAESPTSTVGSVSLPTVRSAATRTKHSTIGAWCLEETRPVSWERLSASLGDLIRLHGDVLLRVKGVIQTTDDPRPLVIHGVQRVFHPPVRLREWTRAPGTSIVAIGDKGAADAVKLIAEALADAVVSKAAAAPVIRAAVPA